MRRCHSCGQPLPWPGARFSPKQRQAFLTIFNAKPAIRSYVELGKVLKISPAGARSLVKRIQLRLNEDCPKVQVILKPLRIVLEKSILVSGRNRQLPLDL